MPPRNRRPEKPLIDPQDWAEDKQWDGEGMSIIPPAPLDRTQEELSEAAFDKAYGVPDVNTLNEFAVQAGNNLPNHTSSMMGRGKYVKLGVSGPVILRTKQQAFRLIAWLETMTEAQGLPDEDDSAHTLDDVRRAIQNS